MGIGQETIPSTTQPAEQSKAAFSHTIFAGVGEMGDLMQATDWSNTELGDPSRWSPALRMMVNFLLPNRFPQLLWWGPEFCSIYNDAYIPILGEKHPWALGRPVSQPQHFGYKHSEVARRLMCNGCAENLENQSDRKLVPGCYRVSQE